MHPLVKYAHLYQKKAVKFVLVNKTVYLALDLGMGKTLISIDVVRRTRIPAVVFAPLKAAYNTWPEEIEKWAPELTYDIIHGPNKFNILRNSKAHFWIINYEGLQWFFQNYKAARRGKWSKRTLILDESSMVKNPSTKRFKTFKKMRNLWSDYIIALSATPAPNGYHELWSQYFILDGGYRLGKAYGKFRDTYFNYMGPPVFRTTIKDEGHRKRIVKIIKPITYRLDAEDYLKMPDLLNNYITLKMPDKLQKTYKQLEDDFFLEFMDESATALSSAALSMKLRQFVQGALYLDEKPGEFQELHRLKVEALKEILETATSPILTAIQFKFDLKMIHKYIDKDIPVIAGGVSNKRASMLIREWNNGNLPILLCHPASIGHGTNLQKGGHDLLWYSLTWSLEQYQQLIGRLRRQGQESASVMVSHLSIKNTIDERMSKAISVKGITQAQLLTELKHYYHQKAS